jgi:uncharacterized membrane protein
MLTATITFYNVVEFVHISSAILAFGATYAYAFAFAVAERSDPRSMPSMLRWTHNFERFMLTPGMVVLLASGMYMAADLDLFDEFFVMAGLGVILILFGLTGAYFFPRERRLLELAERDVGAAGGGEVSFGDDFTRLYKQVNNMGILAGVLVLVVVFLMTTKP